MNDSITTFSEIAQYLQHPLVLIGFVLMLFFSMVNKLMKIGILPQLKQEDGSKIVILFLRYGFWLAILIVLLGFGLQFYQAYHNNSANIQQVKMEEATNINAIVQTLMAKHQQDNQVKDQQIKALTAAVTALSQGKDIIGSESQIKTALAALVQGSTAQAKELFKQETQRVEQSSKQGAEAYRHLGALAFGDNTQEALSAYRRATELDPKNADGWNQLGNLLDRVGELEQAIIVYQKVLALGQNNQNREEVARAYSGLSGIYHTRGELDKALAMQNKALEIDKLLNNKKGIADDYDGLWVVYVTRGEMDKGIDVLNKSLQLNKSLGRKEGIATNYDQLGLTYLFRKRGEFDKAIDFLQKSLQINEALGRKISVATNYGGLGLVYHTQGDLDKALVMYNKSLQIATELGDKKSMADSYSLLGEVYQSKGNSVEAKRHIQKSLEIYKHLGAINEKEVQKRLSTMQ